MPIYCTLGYQFKCDHCAKNEWTANYLSHEMEWPEVEVHSHAGWPMVPNGWLSFEHPFSNERVLLCPEHSKALTALIGLGESKS